MKGYSSGEVSEWPNERAWKVRVLAMVPWVRIPPSPQDKCCSTSGGAAFLFVEHQARLNDRKIKMPTSAAAAIGLTVPP